MNTNQYNDISLADIKPNPDWAKLPIFDRSRWETVRFGDVVDCVNEACDPAKAGIERFIGLEHMEPGSLHVREWGNVADGTTFTRRCRPGQVLFGKRRAYQRKVAVAEFDAVVSGDIYVLTPRGDRLLPELLPYICMSERFFQFAVETSAGSLSPRTNWSHLAQFEFALPPLDQQRRIAEILWAVDGTDRSVKKLLVSLQVARRAEIDGLIPTPSSGAIVARFVRLDRVASMQNGRPFPGADYQQSGVRLIRPGNLAPDGTLDWSPDSTVYMPVHYREQNPEWFIGPGQVLINLTAQSLEDGFMGRVCITGPDDAGLLNQRIGRFIIDGSFHPRFFFRCLQTSGFRRTVENRCEGSKVRHLYFRHFADYELPVLSIAQQERIVARLDAVDSGITEGQKHQWELSRLMRSLTNAMMDGGT